MKQVHNAAQQPAGSLAQDADDCLYDPRVRTALAEFTLGTDTLALEAASAVRAATHAVDRLRARGAQGRGLSAGALDILIRLGATSGEALSIGDLARAADVSSRNVTGLVDTLEREGLAERVPDPDDRRSVLTRITPAGRGWLDTFRLPTQRAMAGVFQGFTPADLTALRHLCLRVVANQQRLEHYLEQTEDALR
ncbi:MarR family transcriptional regulator [Kitasatospora sp. NBC_01287]|uniref:MarR family winged helix-turn-helix transcriptional regulator n=1 Tax=Kitasatospora sp. NBC_01287 TaxID=2903573 RepID=UPI00225497D2|nr:MarR family transcriptional regulator [Kitasatospora sp. NBC_01287]MCX4747742.1 MarR family transcriptional regulator [Kitasatospora sp. NBC_01287]